MHSRHLLDLCFHGLFLHCLPFFSPGAVQCTVASISAKPSDFCPSKLLDAVWVGAYSFLQRRIFLSLGPVGGLIKKGICARVQGHVSWSKHVAGSSAPMLCVGEWKWSLGSVVPECGLCECTPRRRRNLLIVCLWYSSKAHSDPGLFAWHLSRIKVVCSGLYPRQVC